MKLISRAGMTLLLTGLILAPVGLVLAQTAATSADVQARQAALQAQLDEVEKQIAEQTQLLQAKQQESASYQRDIDILNGQINAAQLQIKAKQIQIEQLGSDIGKKQDTIVSLADKLSQEQESLTEILRKYREFDDLSLTEVALAETDFNATFSDLTAFDQIQNSLQQSLALVRSTKSATEDQKSQLETQQNAAIDAQQAIKAEQAKIKQLEDQKKNLLTISQGQESAYKVVIGNREKQRAAILSALFQLRGSAAINFGQALDYAKIVSRPTGIRPAFLMAIITQESNLGENVGTCNRPGDPPAKSWKSIMKPSRDYQPYLAITQSLSLDPDTMPLSCPIGGGWGGAMGPAQFLPSTWLLYQSQITSITGHNPANPWAAEDAFAASGIYLSQLGAAGGNYTAERTAALKYYAGANWYKKANAFYGNEVMQIAADYQSQIDLLQ